MHLSLVSHPDHAPHFTDAAGRLPDVTVVEMNDNPDAVAVLAGAANPLETCRLAAAANRHILIELAAFSAPTEADELGRICNDAGVRLVISPADRFRPAIRSVKETAAAGDLGEPGLLRIHRWQPRSNPGRETNRDTNVSQIAADVDLANWFYDSMPSEIYCRCGQPPAEASTPATYLQVHLGYPKGGMALIDVAHSLPAGDGYYSLSLIGSLGAAYADQHHDMQLLYTGGKPAAVASRENAHQLLAQLENFVASVAAQHDPDENTLNPVRALEVAAQAVLSMHERRAVRRNGNAYELA